MTNNIEREFTSDWVTMYANNWKYWIGDLIGKDGLRALEIGSYEGRSACWFCENILIGQNCMLTCVDSWGYEPIEKKFDLNTKGLNIRKIKNYSYIALANFIANENIYYDFIYIDGNHNAHFVLIDMCMSWKILKKGGVMICDDYLWTSRKCCPPPKIAIDNWLECNHREINGYEILNSKPNCSQIAIWKKE